MRRSNLVRKLRKQPRQRIECFHIYILRVLGGDDRCLAGHRYCIEAFAYVEKVFHYLQAQSLVQMLALQLGAQPLRDILHPSSGQWQGTI